MPHLNTLGARVATLDTRTVKPQPKQTDPHYLSPEHRVWRQTVCGRAGWRCEWIDESGLRHLLRSYLNYYNETRTHLSLDAPVSCAIQTVGRIFARPVLGGLHHQYVRI